MNKVGNYASWLNENDAALERFMEDFKTVIDHFSTSNNDKDSNPFTTLSYSVLASNELADPDKDYHRMIIAMEQHGWSIEDMTKLIKANAAKMESKFGDYSGVVDVFLYRMGLPKHMLAGYNYKDDENPEEAIIKYSYGYNKTPYGKLALEQYFGSADKFVEYAAQALPKTLKNSDNYSGIDTSHEVDDAIFNDAVDKCVHVNGPVVTIDVAGFADAIGQEDAKKIIDSIKDVLVQKQGSIRKLFNGTFQSRVPGTSAVILEDTDAKLSINLNPKD